MNKALFVIDMQEVTVGVEHAKMFHYASDLLEKVNLAINNTDADCVIYIKNLMKKNLLNKLAPVKCFDGMKEAELVEGLSIVSDNIFEKYEGNALSNKELVKYLKENNITEIEVIGVDGGGCVSLTAIEAINAGYKVILNTEVIGTIFEKRKNKYYERLKLMGAEFR